MVASTRRQFTDEQKRVIVGEVEAGDSVSEVARRHNIHASLLFRWRREHLDRRRAAPKQSKAAAFLPVAIRAEPMPSEPSRASHAEASLIEVELTNGRRVRVGAGIDPQILLRLVAALEAKA